MLDLNQVALWNGKYYTFLECVPLVDGSGVIVICQDEAGTRVACPEEMWRTRAEAILDSSACINHTSPSDAKVALFRTLFRGREDVFAKRWQNPKTGKSGYSPACGNEWVSGLCDKRNTPCTRCKSRKLLPLSDNDIYRHLEGNDVYGRDVIGAYAMLPDESTHFLAVDFDGEGWQQDVEAFAKTSRAFGLSPAIERSRSGNGGHVWFFFIQPVSSADARKLGTGLLTHTMERRPELKMVSYDRLFPNQDTLPKGGFGNLIALPLQGRARKVGNSVFVDEAFQPWPDQWAYLSSIERIATEALPDLLASICTNGELGELAAVEQEDGKPWEPTKPAKLTAQDFPAVVELTLVDGLYIKRDGLSPRAQNRIKRLAVFRNPDFYKAQAMRLPTYNKPRVIDTAQVLPEYIKLPRGCLDSVVKLLPNYNLSDKRGVGRGIDVIFNGELRQEQRPAAEALLANETGVLSATTAFGKTVIGAYLIGTRKINTLILVHSTALLAQWKKALEQFLIISEPLPEVPPKRGRKQKHSLIGQIGGGKHSMNGIVDIAVMQSLMEGDEVKGFIQDYGMVICDECHHVPAVSFERVLAAVTAEYVYGLSATPIRQDGHHPIIFMQCGPIRYRVDARSQNERRGFDYFMIPRFTLLRVPNAGELSIQELYSRITENENRNRFIAKDVLAALAEGRSPLVLTERKEHALALSKLIGDGCRNVLLLIGRDGQKVKREKLEQLKAVPASEQLVVVATGKYIGEGFDEPRLDTLFLAMPIAWKGTLAQYAGRLHRSYQGKHEVRIYDYVDIHINMLERMYQKRLHGYRELGYQAKAAAMDHRPGTIFDHHSFYAPFAEDITNAGQEIWLVSPSMQKGRVTSMLQLLTASLRNGASITIITRPPEDYQLNHQADITRLVETLKTAGIHVILQDQIHQKYAVIDKTIVWYGSIHFLSFGKSEESVMRFENADIAGELLDASKMGGRDDYAK